MSPKSLSELDLKDEPIASASMDDLPEFGGFPLLPQPGPFRFKLPADLSRVWEVVDHAQGQRVQMILDRDNPLTITKSPAGRYDGEVFQTRFSNVKRNRGKSGVQASDMDYLLKGLGEKVMPESNKAYMDALITHTGQEFGGDISLSWVCNPKRNVRVQQADGTFKEIEGKKGCATQGSKTGRYYQKDVEKVNGEYPTEIKCACGAVLRAFANIENFRS